MSAAGIIRVVDLETSGFAPPEVPIELGWCDVAYPGDGSTCEVIGTGRSTYVDPAGRAISAHASAVHHIIDEDLVGAPSWQFATSRLRQARDGEPTIAIAAHNKKFEQQWITAEVTALPWICTLKCALRLWPEVTSHSNGALRYEWRLPVDRVIADQSHRAGPDAYVTAHLVAHMLRECSLEELIDWSSKPMLLVEMKFGKHRGKKWSELPVDYLEWMLRQDFDEDAKYTAQHWINERRK